MGFESELVSAIIEIIDGIPDEHITRDVREHLQQIVEDHPCGDAALTTKYSTTMTKNPVHSCLQRKLLKARTVLFYQITHKFWRLEKSGTQLIQSLKTNLDESEAKLLAVFQAKNDERRRYFKSLAKELQKGLLDDVIPAELALIKKLPPIIAKVGVDYDKESLLPTSLLESRNNLPSVTDLQRDLRQIHRLVMVKQERFNGESLLEHFLTKECTRYRIVDRGCSHRKCDMNSIKAKVGYLMTAQQIGYGWIEVACCVECLKLAMTEAEKNGCLLKFSRPASHMNEPEPSPFPQILMNVHEQLLKWRSMELDLARQESSCNCQKGEFKTFPSSGRVNEIVCEKCPRGTYNLKVGADSCFRCPKGLKWHQDSSFLKQCSDSTSTRVDDLEHNRARIFDD